MWRTWLEHARIRAGARLMCSINKQAIGCLNGLTNYVVGEGFVHTAEWRNSAGAPDKLVVGAVQEVIDNFVERNEWNIREREAFWCSRRDGEVAWRFFADEDEGMLSVRQVLPEQIMEPAAGIPYERGSFGILTPPEDLEKPESYWICYDGDAGRPDDPDGVPASEVVFLKLNVDRGVKRGLSDFSFDTYDSINSGEHLNQNMVEGAAIQASIALIRQHDQSTQAEISGFAQVGSGTSADLPNGTPDPYLTNRAARYGPGRIEDIDKGWEYVPPPGAAAGEAHAQVYAMAMRACAARWNAPEWLLSGDASSNSYANALATESPFVKTCKANQTLYKPAFNRTVCEAVRVAANAGRIVVQGRRWIWEELRQVIRIKSTPPSVEVRDKDKEATGNKTRIDGGWKSPQMVAAEEGLSWDDVVRDRKAFAELQQKLQPQQPAPGGPPAEQPPGLGEQWLPENFTGVDSHGHHWVNGKQVPREDSKAGGKQAYGAKDNEIHGWDKITTERPSAVPKGPYAPKWDEEQVQADLDAWNGKTRQRVEQQVVDYLKSVSKNPDSSSISLAFVRSKAEGPGSGRTQFIDRKGKAAAVAVKYDPETGGAIVEENTAREGQPRTAHITPEDPPELVRRKIGFVVGEKVDGKRVKSPNGKLRWSESFTGVDANGHHWVNGKQVAAGKQEPAKEPGKARPGEHGSSEVTFLGRGSYRAGGVDIQIGSSNKDEQGAQHRAETHAAIKQLLGEDAGPEHLAKVVGAPPGAKVQAYMAKGSYGGLLLTVTGPGNAYSAQRSVRRDHQGALVMVNETFFMEPQHQGKGDGAKIFANQVAECKAAGFDRIVTVGGRASGKMNGYYTWPRLGYDGDLKGKLSKKLPQELADATTVQQLLSKSGGKEFWKANGKSIELEFDLNDGSRSLSVLKAYQEEKQKLAAKVSEAVDPVSPERETGEVPDLSPEDEQALDLAWDRIAKQTPAPEKENS